jgi:hypothetical protein
MKFGRIKQMPNLLSKTLTLIFSLTLAVAFAQGLELQTLSHWELHGPVYTVTDRTTNIEQQDGKTTESPSPSWSHKTFSDKGTLIDNIVYQGDEESERFIFSYNHAGQLLEIISYYYGDIQSIDEKIYDKAGTWMQRVVQRDGEKVTVSINRQYLEFDPVVHDATIRVITLNNQGKPLEEVDYKTEYGVYL